MFTRLLEWIRKVLDKMLGTSTVQKAINADLAISAPMDAASGTGVVAEAIKRDDREE